MTTSEDLTLIGTIQLYEERSILHKTEEKFCILVDRDILSVSKKGDEVKVICKFSESRFTISCESEMSFEKIDGHMLDDDLIIVKSFNEESERVSGIAQLSSNSEGFVLSGHLGEKEIRTKFEANLVFS